MIKSVTAITCRRQNNSKLELQEVRTNAAMEAVLPRFIKQYGRAPHGRASSNNGQQEDPGDTTVAPHTGALVVTLLSDKDGFKCSSRAPHGRASSNCSDPHTGRDFARRRAQSIETVARSSLGPQFFAQYDMGCLYATDARDLSFVGDAEQYVSRWMTTIRLSFVTAVSAELPWFDAVNLKRLENVDVHHKP